MHESMFFLSLRRWKAEFILNRHRLNMKEKTNSYTFSRKFRCRMWEKWPEWKKDPIYQRFGFAIWSSMEKM